MLICHDNITLSGDYAFDINRMELSPHHDMPYMHWHDCYEISLVLEGDGIYSFEEKAYPVTAGDIVVINNVEPHRLTVDERPFCQIVTVFSPSFVWSGGSNVDFSYLIPFQNHEQGFNNLISHSSPKSEEMNVIIQDMLSEYNSKAEGWQMMIKARLLYLLAILYRHFRNDKFGYQRRELMRLSSVFHYIEKNFNEKITLTKAAEIAHLTPPYFSAFFKKTTGTSFTDYVNRFRVEQAVRLLKESEDKVTDIAHQCGFTNIGNFNETFLRLIGSVPSAIRKQHE